MKRLLLVLAVLSFIGCVGAPEGTGDPVLTNYPGDWPRPLQNTFGPQECISLDGFYRSGGQSNSTLNERFEHPIFEKNFFALDSIANASNKFRLIHEKGQDRLYFRILDTSGDVLANGIFKSYARCRNGWVISESQVAGGSGDNPVRAQTEVTMRFLAEDGSLIMVSKLRVRTSKFFVLYETDSSEIWYRFTPAN